MSLEVGMFIVGIIGLILLLYVVLREPKEKPRSSYRNRSGDGITDYLMEDHISDIDSSYGSSITSGMDSDCGGGFDCGD